MRRVRARTERRRDPEPALPRNAVDRMKRLGVFFATTAGAGPTEQLSIAVLGGYEGWDRDAADPGVALVESLAYVADSLSFAQDQVADEAYLESQWDEEASMLRVSLSVDLRPVACLVGDHRRAYVVVVGERTGDATVRFGDGVVGRRPPAGSENVAATYRCGAGGAGTLKVTGLDCRRPFVFILARDAQDGARCLCLFRTESKPISEAGET